MKINFVKEYPYEGYSFYDIDTDTESSRYMEELLIDGLIDRTAEIVQILEPSVETLGEELYLLYLAKKNLLDKNEGDRKSSAKRGWETRKHRNKVQSILNSGYQRADVRGIR